MPLYEYRCSDCGERMEVLQRVGEPQLQVCPRCSGTLTKLFSASALRFKGSGFYLTDYPRKSEAKPSEQGSEASKSKEDSGKKAEPAADVATKTTAESKDSKPAPPKP